MNVPETKFTQSGDVSIAYQIVGDGPLDLVIVPGFVSHLEQAWEDPSYSRFLLQLASFSRLILFDKRGTGLSKQAILLLIAIPVVIKFTGSLAPMSRQLPYGASSA